MWLAIEGIVGAGKTTTASLIEERVGPTAILDRFDQHPLLDAYYSDPARFALETELVFMILQAHQLATSPKSDMVSDFAPAKNFVFARLTCSPEDLRLLEIVNERLWRQLPSPDLTIVLNVPAEICKTRISQRGRTYEQNLEVSDLENLWAAYQTSLQELGQQVRSLELTGEESPDEVAEAVIEASGL